MAEDKQLEPLDKPGSFSKNWISAIRQSKYKPIYVILFSSLLFIPFLLIGSCLATIILPILIVVFIWFFKISNIWHQLGIGAAAFCVVILIAAAIWVPLVSQPNTDPISSLNSDKIANGKVTPLWGNESTIYTFTVSVKNSTPNATISVYVSIVEDTMAFPELRNESMTLIPPEPNSTYWNYTYSTHISKSINAYLFSANVSGIWYEAGYVQEGQIFFSPGPISSNSLAIYSTLVLAWALQLFGNGFLAFLILILFLRFSSRSTEARKKMMEDYKKMKVEKEKEVSAPAGKKSEETFICSECGAEVAASAKFCPNCGEPFDEEEPKPMIDIGQDKKRKQDGKY